MSKVLVDKDALKQVLDYCELEPNNEKAFASYDALRAALKQDPALLQEPVYYRRPTGSGGYKYSSFSCALDNPEPLYAVPQPAQQALNIQPPNDSGETMCVVRWMVETPNGWVGSYEKAALEQFAAPQPAQQAVQQPAQELETVRVFGVRPNGEVVDTGINTQLPPRMKARELVREMFGPFEDDDASAADLCFAVCEQLLEWLIAQGWSRTAPQPAQQVVSKDRIREIFLAAGFTIKEGQTDLKKYVYDAAYALLNEAPQPARQPGGAS